MNRCGRCKPLSAAKDICDGCGLPTDLCICQMSVRDGIRAGWAELGTTVRRLVVLTFVWTGIGYGSMVLAVVLWSPTLALFGVASAVLATGIGVLFMMLGARPVLRGRRS